MIERNKFLLDLGTVVNVHLYLEEDAFDAFFANFGVAFPADVMDGILPEITGILFEGESGILDPTTVTQLRSVGYNGFLVGTNFMMQPDPGLALNAFLSQIW